MQLLPCVLLISPQEEVSQRFSLAVCDAPLPEMLRLIVEHVAALTERLKVGHFVVAGIVVEMRASQDHLGLLDCRIRGKGREAAQNASSSRAPGRGLFVPPASISEVTNGFPMRTPAALTAALSAPKSDHLRKLDPVDWIEKAAMAADGHGKALREWSVLVLRLQLSDHIVSMGLVTAENRRL